VGSYCKSRLVEWPRIAYLECSCSSGETSLGPVGVEALPGWKVWMVGIRCLLGELPTWSAWIFGWTVDCSFWVAWR
jgi:hypothetical protein